MPGPSCVRGSTCLVGAHGDRRDRPGASTRRPGRREERAPGRGIAGIQTRKRGSAWSMRARRPLSATGARKKPRSRAFGRSWRASKEPRPEPRPCRPALSRSKGPLFSPAPHLMWMERLKASQPAPRAELASRQPQAANVSASAPSPVCARRVSTAAGPFVAEPASPPGFGGSAGRGGSAGSCGPSGPPGASGPAGSSGTVGSSVAGGVGGPSGSSPRRSRHQYSQIQDSRGRSPPLLGMPTAPAEPEPPRQRRGPALRSSGQALEGDTPREAFFECRSS